MKLSKDGHSAENCASLVSQEALENWSSVRSAAQGACKGNFYTPSISANH